MVQPHSLLPKIDLLLAHAVIRMCQELPVQGPGLLCVSALCLVTPGTYQLCSGEALFPSYLAFCPDVIHLCLSYGELIFAFQRVAEAGTQNQMTV